MVGAPRGRDDFLKGKVQIYVATKKKAPAKKKAAAKKVVAKKAAMKKPAVKKAPAKKKKRPVQPHGTAAPPPESGGY